MLHCGDCHQALLLAVAAGARGHVLHTSPHTSPHTRGHAGADTVTSAATLTADPRATKSRLQWFTWYDFAEGQPGNLAWHQNLTILDQATPYWDVIWVPWCSTAAWVDCIGLVSPALSVDQASRSPANELFLVRAPSIQNPWL